jgi:hypothetical protein
MIAVIWREAACLALLLPVWRYCCRCGGAATYVALLQALYQDKCAMWDKVKLSKLLIVFPCDRGAR